MEKTKLSDLIIYYQQKQATKDEFFGLYFEEKDLESKLSTLQLMQQVLGDVTMPLNYFKTFLYAGHWYGDKNYFCLTESMITDIYDIIKNYDDMPVKIIDSLLYRYNKKCFEEYHVKEYFDLLVSKYKFSEEMLSKTTEYIADSYKKLQASYKRESDKLELIKDQYPYDFIISLKKIMENCYITYDDLMKQLPPNNFFKPTRETPLEFYQKYSDYMFIFGVLRGTISLDDFEDNDYIPSHEEIGQGEQGIVCRKMYTSFTKKEYLDAIKIQKDKVKSKNSDFMADRPKKTS